MIEIRNLTKWYGKIMAVRDISFTVGKGEILGFLGPNGAGKTTTMNMITGILPPSEGTVRVCGYDVMENPYEVKKRIGYLPELPPLYMDMTVEKYLFFVSNMKEVAKKQRAGQINYILELVGIADVRKRLVKNLSKGYRQRVGLAQALIGSPEVLILDEPTVGLDPKQIIEIRKLIRSLSREHTIILSSHILPEVSAVCERVVIINKGEIAAVDTPENLSRGFGASFRLFVTIDGPKDEVLQEVNGLRGIKYTEVGMEKGNNVFGYVIESEKDIDIRRPLFFAMARAGYPILESKPVGMSLEDIFIQLVTAEKGGDNG
jgi:ABC-2 type transport system ATP-binding protein